ncbi:MAG: hypothetical protein FWE14_00190 [Lachnospiraceae bacterium]|nr:hypothetical protein [Lachnospiraceae bacterium]
MAVAGINEYSAEIGNAFLTDYLLKHECYYQSYRIVYFDFPLIGFDGVKLEFIFFI